MSTDRDACAYLEEILREVTPDEEARKKAASHRADLGDWLKNDLGIVRMRETGSWHHGTAITRHSDVDYFVTMPGSRPSASWSALEEVRSSLARGVSSAIVRTDRPAVNLIYFDSGPSVEITPAYIRGTDDYDIPDPDGTGWIQSNPAVHLDYVNDAQKKTNSRAKSLIRLVKTWKARNSVPLSSFYLEMRVAKYALSSSPIIYDWDLRSFFKTLEGDGLREMNDPTSYGRRISTGADGVGEYVLAKLAIEQAVRSSSLALKVAQDGNPGLGVAHWRQLFKG
ncbi:nucleotidyltransferase domain-containing protein [Zhihengliuella halotolerans]|uniref:nucleotidyltransferase domain-containing protein n=1 Tax=Zhihengliuella halotolerans TaxID=370736 RepID=UPI000C80D758|nr:nucleotidyltransferase [Zhihengliuella halotolerans]